ncbi:hypothetical protein ZTR_01925 [Talaromyces verruculosus]|nr:hypothetical protein ZTR_01925 [Talaromyces verruculosus]
MTVVAVAGGTGKLGRAIVEALKRATGHSVLILARSANDHLSKTLDVPVISVDYSNVDSLSNTLEEKKIDTIISTVPITDDSSGESQLNLIDAAIKSPRTKRFVPSEFCIVLNES